MNSLFVEMAQEKTPYQAYTIQHGIELIRIQIPMKNVRTFESSFNELLKAGVTEKTLFLRLVESADGKIRARV